MASCSASFIHRRSEYDVFLSFRGEDTRKNFIDHLYHALQQKGIRTYKDDERINKGKKICDELIRAIEDSKFYIIVFSKNYASSSWCLDELVKIMECHKTNEHTAYPVFYDVEPTEVRKQSGAVGEAFAKHENEDAAGKWRGALKEAADLAGWELKTTTDGHEAKFIQKVVEEISLELRGVNFNIDEKLVGMETRVNDVLSSVGSVYDDVRIIGIKGMGGGGKTTLARAIFDQISFQFEGKSFVENVREVSKASLLGLKSLQKQILSDVFNDKGMTVSSVHEGIGMMKRMMPGKKVILVLDDVDHREQLKSLAGDMTWFKPGSIIIITTRDQQVLEFYREKLIHDIQLLSDEDAMCLFRRYVFGKAIPNPRYEKLSAKFVQYAAGLPLAIEVLGSFLCGKDELEWTDALSRLKTIPTHEILEILEISYDGLENEYKEIFLNVACTLKGWRKDKAIEALESCGFYARNGLRVLELKSLITCHDDGDDDYLRMHDHIEEMGMNIVRRSHPDNPNKHSRLWINEEITDVLAKDLGTEATRYIHFYIGELSLEIAMQGLRKMKELRFLHLSGRFYDASESQNWKCNELPNALRYLCWYEYPFRSLPTAFQADNFVSLEMRGSRIVRLWEGGERKVLKKLRFLDLSFSELRAFDLGVTPNLETLELESCLDLIELRSPHLCLNLRSLELDESKLSCLDLRLAPNLETLSLGRCMYLVELLLPERCLNLRSLELSESKLRTLDIGQSPNLEYLNLKDCDELEELHMADGCLRKLVYLDLSGSLRFRSFEFQIENGASCSVDESLEGGPLAELILIAESGDECHFHPDSNLPKFQFECYYKEDRPLFSRNLEKLISVGLCACTNLDTLSRSICGLQHLRRLKLQGSILEAPKDLGQLEFLQQINFSYTMISHLPDNICLLKHLKSIKLGGCSLPEKLPEDLGELECLEKLVLSFTNIQFLPDSICMLQHLHTLELNDCLLLEKLPEDLGRLECLEYLYFGGCELLREVPDSICNIKCLTHLYLSDCIRVEKLPEEIGRLECLEHLGLQDTGISHLPQSIFLLKGLFIYGSRGLLQSFGFTSEIQCLSEDFSEDVYAVEV